MNTQQPMFTMDELNEFDIITRKMSSQDQLQRITGRLDCSAFVAKHGEDKCNAMFSFLTDSEKD